MRALRGLQLPGHLSTVPVSRNFLNSFLTPRFVQLFSGNSSVNLFAVYPFKDKIFYQKSCPRRKHSSDVCCDKFPMPNKLISKLNK